MKKIDIYKCSIIRDDSLDYSTPLESVDEVVDLFRSLEIQNNADEAFWIACVNTKGHILGLHEVSHGDLTSSITSPREIFKRALLNNAFGIFMCHNHPSGDSRPSGQDIQSTERLIEAGKLLGINVLDHIVLGMDEYTSIRTLKPEMF